LLNIVIEINIIVESPTKQAKGNKGEKGEPKLHQWQNGEINLMRNQTQSLSSPLANERTVCDYDSGSATGQKSDWIRTFTVLSSSIWLDTGFVLFAPMESIFTLRAGYWHKIHNSIRFRFNIDYFGYQLQ